MHQSLHLGDFISRILRGHLQYPELAGGKNTLLGDKEEKEMEICPENENIEKVSCPSVGRGTRWIADSVSTVENRTRERVKQSTRSDICSSEAVALLLAVAIGFFGKGVLDSNLVGKVNGEGITREEFSKRVEQMKRLYENRYGENLFQGEEGTQNLNRLKAQILDEMVTEKVLLQEARNAGYTSAPPEEIEKELEAIKKKNGLSTADLEKMIGGKIEDLKAELGKEWVISQFVEKAVLKGQPAEWGSHLRAVACKSKSRGQD